MRLNRAPAHSPTSLLFVLQGWLNTRRTFEQTLIMNLFESSFPELLRFATQNLTFRMDVLEAFIVRQACDLLEGLIPGRNAK